MLKGVGKVYQTKYGRNIINISKIVSTDGLYPFKHKDQVDLLIVPKETQMIVPKGSLIVSKKKEKSEKK